MSDHHHHDRDVIVTGDTSGGVGGVIAAVILVLGIVLAVWFFLNTDLGNESAPGEIDVNVTVETPAPGDTGAG